MPEWLNYVLTIVGTIGLTTVWAWLVQLLYMGAGRQWLRFHVKDPLAIILVTSSSDAGGVSGVEYRRQTVSLSTLLGANEIASLSSRLGYRKRFDTSVSETIAQAPTGDVAFLGGGLKNRLANEFTKKFNKRYPHLAIDRETLPASGSGRMIRIGQQTFEFQPALSAEGNLMNDLALLVMWRNPFAAGWRRGMMCAGFSSWGTHAAAKYVGESLRNGRYRRARGEGQLPRSLSRTRPEFLVVLDVTISGNVIVGIEELAFIPIGPPEMSAA